MQTNSSNDQTALRDLCLSLQYTPVRIESISEGGSGRRYYRITLNTDATIIGTCGDNICENKAFIYLSRHIREKGLPVPDILGISSDFKTYLQTDVGCVNLYELIKAGRENGDWNGQIMSLLHKTVSELPSIQFLTAQGLDVSRCLPPISMDARTLMRDLNYFKYCFLKPLDISLDEDRLDNCFETLIGMTSIGDSSVPRAFILRDCQSRNVMFDEEMNPHWIDYQHGRLGPVTYDLASLLWQTRAAIPASVRDELIAEYFREMLRFAPGTSEAAFRRSLRFMVICRLLQVLGAYGLRGIIEGKVQFLKPIPLTLQRLEEMLRAEETPSLEYLLHVIGKAMNHPWCGTHELGNSGLFLDVCSFSYKRGMPRYRSEHGGGFVFDCRAPHNPGRYAEYRHLTGRDPEVITFLMNDGEMPALVDSAYDLVSKAVKRYLERGFDSLSVAFGCTGGRHRSVFGAEQLAKRINREFNIPVSVNHTNLGISYILSPENNGI